LRGSIPRCLAVVSPSESKSNLGAITSATEVPTNVKSNNGIKSLELVKANEPKLQNEIDLASERETAVVNKPTTAEIVAESESPIITKLRGVGSNKMLVEILEIRKYENRLGENFSLFFDI
jgi:hypothetical protein